jgi:hypothetical protein
VQTQTFTLQDPCDSSRDELFTGTTADAEVAGQAFADRLGTQINVCLNMDGELWPDVRVGEWGGFWPKARAA